MSVANSSRAAYLALKRSGKENTQKAKVLAQVIQFPSGITRRELAGITGLELGAVCGRVNALIAEGALREHGSVECERTGKHVKVVKPVRGVTPTQGSLL